MSMSLLLALLPTLAQHATPAEATDEERAGHQRMVARLAELAQRAESDDLFVGTGALPSNRQALAALGPGTQPKKRFELLGKIGLDELRLGDTEAAVASYSEACALIPRLAGSVAAPELRRARYQLALALLRLGETRNCIARHTSASCLLPIRTGGVHVDQEGSRKAIAVLTELLAEEPGDLAARWLLNIACMTVGEHPDGVPEPQRIPPAVFEAGEAFPHFTDVAPELGLNSMTLAGGVVIDDFDGDDVLDLAVSAMDLRGQLQLFRGQGDGTFVERTEAAGLVGITGGLNLVQTDHDGDGDLDLFVPRGAWLFDRGRVPCSLLRNDGGHFTDVTFAAGLAEPALPSQVAAWADYDGDGDLDLFKGNEWSAKLEAPCQLFRNRGDGTFEDVASVAGVRNERFCKGASWGDYDGDRRPDLYVSNTGQANRLYHNKGDGTFEDVAEQAGVLGPERSFPTWFWDYDNDGALDLYVSTYVPILKPFVRSFLGGDVNAELACLYKGDGHGGFRDVARALGLTQVTVTMGANFGDLDDDGFLDFYLGTGFPEYDGLVPNKMYWNRAGQRFADVTVAGGFGHLQKGHAIAFGDLDGDGDQDVFAEMGGAFRGDPFGNALFRNPGNGNHRITLKLVGTRSNRAAIGARIRCEFRAEGTPRTVFRHVNSGASFGANPLRQSLGLGQATRVDVLEVYWPTSDLTQTFRDVPADASYVVTEGRDELVRIGR